MHDAQRRVSAFMRLIGHEHEIGKSPEIPASDKADLCARLILEEAIETACALVGGAQGLRLADKMIEKTRYEIISISTRKYEEWLEPNLVEVIDGICDNLVVDYDAANFLGVDIEPFFDEVMRTNELKVGGPIVEGKRMKPPGWKPPRIAEMLERLRETGDARLPSEPIDHK